MTHHIPHHTFLIHNILQVLSTLMRSPFSHFLNLNALRRHTLIPRFTRTAPRMVRQSRRPRYRCPPPLCRNSNDILPQGINRKSDRQNAVGSGCRSRDCKSDRKVQRRSDGHSEFALLLTNDKGLAGMAFDDGQG